MDGDEAMKATEQAKSLHASVVLTERQAKRLAAGQLESRPSDYGPVRERSAMAKVDDLLEERKEMTTADWFGLD